jgi:hypothetical protein
MMSMGSVRVIARAGRPNLRGRPRPPGISFIVPPFANPDFLGNILPGTE